MPMLLQINKRFHLSVYIPLQSTAHTQESTMIGAFVLSVSADRLLYR